MNIFIKEYLKLNEVDNSHVQFVKEYAESLYTLLDNLDHNRETALAKTKLEECVMWAVKGITG